MRKILALSTDLKSLDGIGKRLNTLGFEVKKLTNPEEVFSEIHDYQPDALIMDFVLNNHNGGAICHQLKCDPQTNKLPVIILSDYDGLERFSNKFGCNAIVNKASVFNTLGEKVKAVLNGSIFGGELAC